MADEKLDTKSAASAVKNIESGKSHKDRREEGIRKQRKQREAEESQNFINKWATKWSERKKSLAGADKQGWLVEPYPYYVTPSFIEHNGRVISIVELYNRSGANRNMAYHQIIDMIPSHSMDNVEIHMIVNDSLIKGDTKKRLIRKNAKAGKETISDTVQHGSSEDKDNISAQIMNESDIEDYDDYEMILNSADPVAVFRISLVIIGPDRETVDEQLELLNRKFDQRHEGAQWDSLGGDQYGRFTKLFAPLPQDRFVMTSTAENYSGLNFSVNAGLNDENGMPVGRDALSLVGSSAFFDMDGTLGTQSIIAIPRTSQMVRYTREDATKQPSAASILAQYSANQSVMNGHRVHHIVLNDFDYVDERGLYYRKPSVKGMFDKYDVSSVTINPLQGFGDINDVVAIYSRLTQKIVNIFNILDHLSMDEQTRALVLDVVEKFYTNHDLWNDDAELYPKRTRIVGITDPEDFPNAGMLINEFTTLADDAMQAGREAKTDRIEALQSLLRQSLTAYRGILGRPTSIRDTNARQVYYDFNRIESQEVRQVQFINILDYIIFTAARDDVVIIHGCDRLWSPVLNMVSETIQAAQDKGVRFLFSYDSVSNDTTDSIKRADIFDMQSVYYKDLDSDVSWSIVGKCLSDEVDEFEAALATQLSPTIRYQMQEKYPCQVLVHRSRGDVNSFVHLSVVV